MNGPVRDAYGWARNWPTWVLVVVCVAGAVVLALYGRLDDWLRAVGGVLFLGAAAALIIRLVVRAPK